MKPVDREGLKAWYRIAMRGRVRELEELRPALLAGERAAVSAARDVGHALRGSGGSFGFPEVSESAVLLEDAPEHAVARRSEGMTALLRRIAWIEDPDQHLDFAWLACAAGVEPVPGSDDRGAWRRIAEAAGLTEETLAERAAARFGLETSSALVPSRQALRLVPEGLMRDQGILPLSEDGVLIRVATSNPTALVTIGQLQRLTGRRPDFVLVPPGLLAGALNDVLGDPVASRTPPATRIGAGRPADGRPAVLLVDDDPMALVLARSVLEKKGYTVLEASTGEAGLEALERHPEILVVVVDLEMPGMGGRGLVRAIRATAALAHVPVVVLTGSENPVLEADLIEDGADDYIRKPLDPRLFLARIASTLRRVGS